jgi:aromatic ring hydroxylase
MAARTGSEYLQGLKASSPDIWVGSERVEEVTEHPALAGGAQSMARLFDLQHEFADDCLMEDPETGELMNNSHMMPRSQEDLVQRGRGMRRIAGATVGMMGRSPDYVNCSMAGFAAQHEQWSGADGANTRGSQNLVEWQKMARREDLACTHAIVNPTTDYAHELAVVGNPAVLHKVDETSDAIVVHGAKALATLAPFSDELIVWPGHPLFAEGSEPYALSFAIPLATPGLSVLCRDSVAAADGDRFDRPLSSRFDEQDALLIFDDVEIPKHRVFIDGHLGVYNSAVTTGWLPNFQQHTTIRALTKLQFALGLAARIADSVNDESPHTIDMLGELYCYVALTESALLLSEEHCRTYPGGVVFPDDAPLDPMRVMMTQWMPRALEIIKLIGRHNLLATPSRAMLDDPRLSELIDITLAGANGVEARDRIALYRLAWDFVGSALAGRHDLYERFYILSGRQNKRIIWLNAAGKMGDSGGIGEGLEARKRTPVRDRAYELVDSMLADSALRPT